jgi:predicted RNase H-like nuclease
VTAVGIDGCKAGWMAVALGEGGVQGADVFPGLAAVLAAWPDADAYAIDMPVGLPERGRRRADEAARAWVGPRAASVFFAPPRAALLVPYAEALSVSPGLSRQAYSLGAKILEVEPLAGREPRVVEVHPECSFRELAGEPVEHPKTNWAGFRMRVRLLEAAGVVVPELPDLPILDTVDAAAAAWSGLRVARGEARTLPQDPAFGESVIYV